MASARDGTTIARAVEDKPVDAPDPALDVINPHYATAAATQLGGDGGIFVRASRAERGARPGGHPVEQNKGQNEVDRSRCV